MQNFKIYKFVVFTIIFYVCLFGHGQLKAEVSLEEEVRFMKSQFEAMQKHMQELETKVNAQETQIKNNESTKVTYEKRIADLEEELAKRKSEPVVSQSIAAKPPMTKWMPDIGVVGDAVFTLNSAKKDTEGADRLSLRELELILGSAIDPFSRLDATISFSDTENPSLEEAYMTAFNLPWAIIGRLGKFKPHIGKAIGVHRDSLETVNEPLVIQRYFGVEGYNKSGVDFTKTLDIPSPLTHQVSIGVLEGGNGEDGTIFGTTRRTPTGYGHIKNYLNINDTTGLEFGFSDLVGSRDDSASGFEVDVLGFDTTLTHQINANQNVKLQGEAFNVHRKQTFNADSNIWGAYGLADLRFAPQWSVGGRYDYVELVDNVNNSGKADQGLTGYFTFYQSEFARWRAQFTHQDLTTGKDNNSFMLQGTFAIGEHKHKIQ